MDRLIIKNKIYTGVGSRQTPDNQQQLLTNTAKKLDLYGFTLRSGHADGADLAFERGSKKKEVYVPWKSFNNHNEYFPTFSDELYDYTEQLYNEHKDHSEFGNIKDPVQKLMMRNVYQVLGSDINNPVPSDFLICFADEDEKGNPVGGTGFTVYIAKKNNVPIFNINNLDDFNNLKKVMTCLKYDKLLSYARHLALFHYKELDDTSKEIVDQFEENSIYFKKLQHEGGKNVLELLPELTSSYTKLLKLLYKRNKELIKKTYNA